jgi:cytochrome c
MKRRRADVVCLIAALASIGMLPACGSDEQQTTQPVPGGDPDHGRAAIMQYGCTSCHSVPGVGSVADGIGPDLAGLADRRLLAGQVPNRPENLLRWLQDPQELAPGTVMPDMGVTEKDARDIAAYLYDQ